MQLTSPIFNDQDTIPEEYAFKGKNRNPPLAISNIPTEAASLALIMHDPDGWKGDFLHWIVWDIPPNTSMIEENTVPSGAIVGLNGKGVGSYMRPTPLAHTGIHHYIFELYALNAFLNLPADASRETVETAINAHLIEKTQLVGLYSR